MRCLQMSLLAALVLLSGFDRAMGHAQSETRGYRQVENWAGVPPDFHWGELADADFDEFGNLWVLHRPPTPGMEGSVSQVGGETPVLMFDRSLKLVRSFGKGTVLEPHGIELDVEGNVWVTDSGPFYEQGVEPGKGRGYQIFKFNRDGKLLMTLGKAGVSGAGPDTFVAPTDVIVNEKGEIFVADGHSPSPEPSTGDRIVKLSRDGTFIKSWGTRKGSQPGEVSGPHRLAMDSQGRLFVADRGNRRIQIFDQEGTLLDQWTQFGGPSGLYIDKQDVLYIANPGGDLAGVHVVSAKNGARIASITGTGPEVVVADPQLGIFAGLVAKMKLERYVLQ